MKHNIKLTIIAQSVALILGSSPMMPVAAEVVIKDQACNGQSSQCSGINWYDSQRLWGLRSPSESSIATLTGTPDTAASIYFSSEALRKVGEHQTLTLSGTNLTGHLINTSYGGEATVNLTNGSKIDVIETSNSNASTTTYIVVDGSTIHGGKSATYDNKNKPWLQGVAIYNDSADSGDNTIDILNNSTLTGNIVTGGAGVQDIDIDSSVIAGGAIIVFGAGSNKINIYNSTVDNSNSSTANPYLKLQAGDNAIYASGLLTEIEVKNSSLTGDLNLNDSAQTILSMVKSAVHGDISINKGTVSLDATTVDGSITSNNGGMLSLGKETSSFSNNFSGFDSLEINGPTLLVGGLTNSQVGVEGSLNVTGDGALTSAINLSSGSLVINHGKLLADTIALTESASLTLNNSGLRTNSQQIFTNALDVAGKVATAGDFNTTGQRITFNSSVLSLDDLAYNLAYVQSVHKLLGEMGGTTLLMEGQLVDGDGVVDKATVAEAASTGSTLVQVDVGTDKSHLIVGKISDDLNTEATLQGFGASSLQLASVPGGGPNEVTISNGQFLTLTGAHGGALIDVLDTPDAIVNVAIEEGTLQLGTRVLPNATGTLNGTVNVGETGEMLVAAGTHTITGEGVNSRGQVTIDDAAILKSDVTLTGQSTLTVLGSLQADKLTADTGTVISVGNGNSAGNLLAGIVDLNGAKVFLDPVWQNGSIIDTASRAVLGGSVVNGLLSAGQNSVLVLGDIAFDNTSTMFANTGLNWSADGITAALSIVAPQTLDVTKGGLRVDGGLISLSQDRDATANQATFADNSLLMVNADAAAGQAALSAIGGTLNVADSAKLYISGAKVNSTYNITNGFSSSAVSDNGWAGSNLILNRMLNGQRTVEGESVTVTTTAKAAADALPGVVLPNTLDSMIQNGLNSATSPSAGIRFLSRVLDAPQASTSDIVRTVNSAAQMATAGAVQNTLLTTTAAATRAIQDHNSIANHSVRNGGQDADVWVNVLYGNNRNRDFSAGSMDYGYNTNFYGVIAGADVTRDVGPGQLRSGAALHAGNGKVNSSGDFNSTKNDFNFFGASLYESWRVDSFSINADVGYSASNNDLQQRIPGYFGMGSKIKGSVDAQLLSVGMIGEYLFKTDVVDVIPYAGVRYNQLTTKGFTTKVNNEAMFSTGKERQDIWQFPIGVRLSKNFAVGSGWNVSPQADLAVVPVAGDTHANTKVRTYGVSATDTMNAQVMDDTSFNGQLGVKMQKGNMTWGISYNLATSEHETGQAGTVSFKYAF
ncbi:autotransporter outer membrane beta-barrel domain-containing protein [Kluyvera chengduensis]|uniref:autotransporter outer membrane beta-barrel domain-containing protein n=1 Tax=Kluyvera sp. 142359 TaxID=3375726 RepID=UPI0037717D64